MTGSGTPPPGSPPPGSEDEILDTAQRWLTEGRRLALATVVETWGSSPRPAGSMMLVDDGVNMLGSVSGGCIEGAVVEEAKAVIAERKPKVLQYGVTDEMAWEVGLTCGGTVRLYLEPLG
jgi:xanthine/CO dehydrogenase XdhC/CoxF family maturation factor